MESEQDQTLAQRQALEAAIEQCQKALKLLKRNGSQGDSDGQFSLCHDSEIDELDHLLKIKVMSPVFVNKLRSIFLSNILEIAERPVDEFSSWDLVTEADLLRGKLNQSCSCINQESYVVVNQEDIVEGIACYMARYLLTLNNMKEMTPEQLQEALKKTFSVTKNKGKLRKIWDGSKTIYNMASWGATAVGIYCNPTTTRAASKALSTSRGMIAKLISK